MSNGMQSTCNVIVLSLLSVLQNRGNSNTHTHTHTHRDIGKKTLRASVPALLSIVCLQALNGQVIPWSVCTHTNTPLTFACEVGTGRLMILAEVYQRACPWGKGKGNVSCTIYLGDFNLSLIFVFLKLKRECTHDKNCNIFSDLREYESHCTIIFNR